jgi:hypothetical protein
VLCWLASALDRYAVLDVGGSAAVVEVGYGVHCEDNCRKAASYDAAYSPRRRSYNPPVCNGSVYSGLRYAARHATGSRTVPFSEAMVLYRLGRMRDLHRRLPSILGVLTRRSASTCLNLHEGLSFATEYLPQILWDTRQPPRCLWWQRPTVPRYPLVSLRSSSFAMYTLDGLIPSIDRYKIIWESNAEANSLLVARPQVKSCRQRYPLFRGSRPRLNCAWVDSPVGSLDKAETRGRISFFPDMVSPAYFGRRGLTLHD